MSIKGTAELKARLRAIRVVFKPIGRDWADETVILARAAVPKKTGRLQRSIRRQSATMQRAKVVAHYTQYFVDAGTKAHFEPRHNYFSKVQHPRVRARPFRARVAREALRRKPMAEQVIRAWNDAGGFARLRGGV
jgi:hypothetical protein